MANRLSDVMTNRLASPRTLSTATRGVVYYDQARINRVAGDANGLIHVLWRMPAHLRMLSLWITSAPAGGGVGEGYHLGVYRAGDWLQADQTLVDVDALAADIDPAGIRVRGALIGAWSGTAPLGISEGPFAFGMRLWESVVPAIAEPRAGTEYDVCLTKVSGTAVTGILDLGMQYVFGI